MQLALIDVIGILTTFLLLFMAGVLLSYKTGKRTGNLLLSAFLFANALLIIQFFTSRLGIIPHQTYYNLFYIILRPLYFLIMPLFYLFTLSLCYQEFTLRKNHLFHFTPYLTAVIYLLLSPKSVFFSFHLYRFFLYTLLIAYLILILYSLNRYDKTLRQKFAELKTINFAWLKQLLWGYVAIIMINLGANIVEQFFIYSANLSQWLQLSMILCNFAIITAIVYRSLSVSRFFKGIEQKPKYAGSKLSPYDFSTYKIKIKTYMEMERPYLNPDISLENLARDLSILPKYLSQVINESYRMNFYDFINSHRIEEFKHLLTQSEHRDKTILELLYEVGFNSKTTFNTFFKKHTRMTPTQYRKSLI
jgi:AraC-like DNA-binding protein